MPPPRAIAIPDDEPDRIRNGVRFSPGTGLDVADALAERPAA